MIETIADKIKIDRIFNRGIVKEILPSKEDLLNKLYSGNKLRIYIGADPTSNSLHLSHAKNYIFLEELRQLGHEVIILVGDFTAQIGDPTGENMARKQLTKEQIKKNVKEWLTQIKPLIDFDDKNNPPRVFYNSKWLAKLNFEKVVSLSANFTVQQMISRDMFQKRLEKDEPIYLHEFLYPLMQGYDSVVMEVDAELCGTDQIFNALAGRTLLKRLKNKDKFVIAVNLMENPKTKELMSKSRGTGVFLSSPPNEMFGAIMAQPDEMIESLFINVTRIPLSEKDKILALGPRDAKILIAQDIIKRFYGDTEAEKAKKEFNKVFSRKEAPTEIPEWSVKDPMPLIDLLVKSKMASSKSEAKRLFEQKAVSVNDKVSTDWSYKVNKGDIVKIGPRKFLKIN